MGDHRNRMTSKAVLVCCVLFPIGCGMDEYSSATDVYKATFGDKPGLPVRGLQAYGQAFADSSTCYLRFQAPQTQLEAMLGDKFIPMTDSEFESRISGASIAGPTPVWWKPFTGSPTVFLRSGIFHPGFTQGQALVSYDPKTQIVHIYWDGLD